MATITVKDDQNLQVHTSTSTIYGSFDTYNDLGSNIARGLDTARDNIAWVGVRGSDPISSATSGSFNYNGRTYTVSITYT